jgi:hypothetical protein
MKKGAARGVCGTWPLSDHRLLPASDCEENGFLSDFENHLVTEAGLD